MCIRYVLYLIFTHAYSTNVEQREKKNINTQQKKESEGNKKKEEEEEEGKNNTNKQTGKEIGIT